VSFIPTAFDASDDMFITQSVSDGFTELDAGQEGICSDEKDPVRDDPVDEHLDVVGCSERPSVQSSIAFVLVVRRSPPSLKIESRRSV
jgi:hypothetical protein